MSVDVLPVSTQDVFPHRGPTSESHTPGFDERWAAWQARGAAHDRIVRRRMMFAVPILAIVAAALYGLLLG